MPDRTIPPSVKEFWDAYCATVGRSRDADFYEPFHFHDNEQGALELAELVLRGPKRGSASLVWTYEHDQTQPPWPGSLSVMTDWHGRPLGIIETLKIEAVPFEDVSAEFAAIEGEGDGSLRYWQEGHWAYFIRECRRIGRQPDKRMLVYCEQFDLVFPAAGAAHTIGQPAVNPPTLFAAIGGADGVLRLAHAWHQRVLADEIVSHAFSHGFHPQHTERLAAYWAEAWGGPAHYTQAYGSESSVVRMHSGNGEHEEMDRRAIHCFELALADAQIHDPALQRVLVDYFRWATTVRMAAYPASAKEVPADLSVQRWSWTGPQS